MPQARGHQGGDAARRSEADRQITAGPYETVAGYFLAHTGKMGAVGDVLHSDEGCDMKVTQVDGRRIAMIEVRKAEDSEHAGDSGSGEDKDAGKSEKSGKSGKTEE